MADIIKILGKIIIALFILAIIIFAAILMVVGITSIYLKEDSMRAGYSYDLTLSTSKPVYNATLLLPLPCGYDDESGEYNTFLSLSEVSFHNFDTDNISVQVDVQNGYRVLNISSKTILPLYKNHIMPIAILPGQNRSELPPAPATVYSHSYSPETPVSVPMEIHLYYLETDSEINTKQPFEKEQLMRPFTVLNRAGKDEGFFSNDYSESQIEVPVYLSYKTDPDNILDISSSVRGANEWWSFGWSGNSYRQRIGSSFEGSCNGTYILEGVLTAGEGAY